MKMIVTTRENDTKTGIQAAIEIDGEGTGMELVAATICVIEKLAELSGEPAHLVAGRLGLMLYQREQ